MTRSCSSQPSSSNRVLLPIAVTQREEGKTKWLIEKRVFTPSAEIAKFREEIPSNASLSSYLALNGVDQNEGLGTWLGFRFFRDPKTEVRFSGVYLTLLLDLSTSPIKVQRVWEGMLKKLLEPDDDLAGWMECIKGLSVWKETITGGFLRVWKNTPPGFVLSMKTNISEIEYGNGNLADKVRDFFRLPLEEHGVASTNNGLDEDFMKNMSI